MSSSRLRLSLVAWIFASAMLPPSVLGVDTETRVAPVLKKLTSALKRIEANRYGNVDKVMKIRPAPLVGLSKAEILAALGEPSVECDSGEAHGAHGRATLSLASTPCARIASVAVQSFP
jgi:hypothetical protein